MLQKKIMVLKMLQKKHILSDNDIIEITKLLNEGFSYTFITELNNVSHPVIINSLQRYYGKEKYYEIYKKFSLAERKRITKEYELSEIRNILKKNNLLKEQLYPVIIDNNELVKQVKEEFNEHKYTLHEISNRNNIDLHKVKQIIFN